MEQAISIATSDTLEIKGILNSMQQTNKLVVFVHGFTGNLSEAHFYCAKEYFTKKWYDVFRCNLYTNGDDTRKLKDCSVKIHSYDIQKVCEYFSQYDEVCLVWHSLAWPCLWWVEAYPENVKKIIFWDPAFEMRTTGERCFEQWGLVKIVASGKHVEVSREMLEEFLEDDFLQVLQRQAFPKENMYTIFADGDRHVKNKPELEALKIECHVIEWSNHGFTQEWKYEELFEKTLEYIEK